MQNNPLEDLKAKIALFEKQKQEMVEQLQNEFLTLLSNLFKQAPKLKSYGWTQYTPYFNDGDSCRFGVNGDDSGYVNGTSMDEDSCICNKFNYRKLENNLHVLENLECSKMEGQSYYNNRTIGDYGLCFNPDYDETTEKVVKEIQGVLNVIPEEIFENLFGDHGKVTVYSDNTIKVEEYEHD